MSEITKQALKVENNQSFPNNNAGLITPSNLRTFNEDMIDSLVSQITYTADSASFNSRINNITGSATDTGSLLLTASFASQNLTFTKGDGSQFSLFIPDNSGSVLPSGVVSGSSQINYPQISNIPSGIVSGSSQVSYTGLGNVPSGIVSGAAQVIELLPSGVVSGSSQITDLGFVSSSITGSSLTTASLSGNTITFTKGDNTTFGFTIPDVSGSTIDTGSFATTGSNTFTGQQTIQNNLVIEESGNQLIYTQFVQDNLTNKLQVSQAGASGINFNVNVAMNELTASIQEGYVLVGGASNVSKLVATSSFIDTINTGSFATTGSNNFIGNQSITGSVIISSSATIDLEVIGQSRVNGTLLVTGSSAGQFVTITQNNFSLASGSIQPNVRLYVGGITAQNSIGGAVTLTANPSLMQPASGVSNITNPSLILGKTGATTNYQVMEFQTSVGYTDGTTTFKVPLIVSGAVNITSSLSHSLAQGNVLVGDASNRTQAVPTSSLIIPTASLANEALDIVVNVKNTTGTQINKGTIVRIIGATGDNPLIGTASWEDDSVSANTLGWVVADIPNDSFGRVMTQGTLLSINTDPALGFAAGQLLYLSSSGQYTNQIPPAPYHEVRLGQVLRAQQNNGSVFVLIQNGYELNELHDVNITTGSLANKDLLAYNSSSQQWENNSISSLGIATTGSNTFIGNQIISGSVDIQSTLTSSLQQGYVWVGDSSGRTTTVSTGSFGGSAFPFNGSAQISGSLGVTGSMSGKVNTLSVASSTASVNFSDGNMFTITLPTGSTTHITPSNIKAGQTINIQISQANSATTGSVSFSPNVLFAGGNDYQVTATGSAIDLLTFVSLDGTNVLGTSIKNFL